MKKIFTLIAITFLSIVLISCNKKDDGKITINFWHMSPVGSESYTGMKKIINDFNESQDEFVVKGMGFSFWDYWDKISISVSSKTAPDIGFNTLDDVEYRASNSALFNITELNNKFPDPIDFSNFRDSQLDFAKHNGDLYGMPLSTTVRALYYNLDMFEEVGLTEDDVPKTWEELKLISKQLDIVGANGKIERLGFDPTYTDGFYHSWLWQANLDFFDENKEITLNTPGHLEVLNWILDFNKEYKRSELDSFGEANQMLGINPFAAEKIAMAIGVDGLYRVIKDAKATFRFGVAPIPIPEGGRHVNWGSGFSIEMYDNKKNDDKRTEGAFKFYKYLLSKETQIRLAEVNGWLTSHIGAMEEFVEGDPILEALLREADYAVDKVYIEWAPSWHGNDFTPYYNDAIAGRITPEQLLETVRNNLIKKRDNYYSTK